MGKIKAIIKDSWFVHVFTTGEGESEAYHHHRVEQWANGDLLHIKDARLDLVPRLTEVLGYEVQTAEETAKLLAELGVREMWQEFDVKLKDQGIRRTSVAFLPKAA
jgi:hypothetical protein